MTSEFMLRQRKLLEDIKKNEGVPPLKSLYGPVTPTANTANNGLQNITGPGGQEFYDATNKVKDAYKKGGVSSALGIGLRNTPGVIAATIRDTITPEPLRRGLSNLAEEAGEFTKATITGKPTIDNNRTLSQIRTNRDADAMLYGDQAKQVGGNWNHRTLANPRINENQDARRDSALGAMTSSAEALSDGGQRNTYSIGGNTLSYNLSDNDLAIKKSIEDIDSRIAQGFEPTPEQATRISGLRQQAGYMRGGTDRGTATGGQSLRNLNVNQGTAAQQAEAKFNFMPPVNPTEEQFSQYDFQEGLKSGRTQRPTDPYAGLSARAKRELMVQESRNRQSGLNNAANNAVAAERNDILRENNYLQSQVKPRPEAKVIKVPDGFGGTRDEIMVAGPDGVYRNAMGNQAGFQTPTAATIAKMRSMKGNKKAEDIYIKRFGQLPY